MLFKLFKNKFSLVIVCLCASVLLLTNSFGFFVSAFSRPPIHSEAKTGEEINSFLLNKFNQKSQLKYSEKIEKTRKIIESKIVELEKKDPTILNNLVNKNNVEQTFEYSDEDWIESDSTIKVQLKEIRKTVYPDGQFGLEVNPLNIEFKKSTNTISKFQEYDLAGNIYDKNKKNLTAEEMDKLTSQFLDKYKGNPKSVTNSTYSNTVPKESIAQRQFFKNKNDQMLNSKIELNSQPTPVSLNPFEVKVQAASTYDKYGAANYARNYANGRNWAYPQYEFDCTNFASQATLAGGLLKDYNNNDTNSKDWYIDAYFNKSRTWSVASNYADHMYDHENTGPWQKIYPSNAAYILDYGDLVFLNDNTGTHHVMMITGAYWTSPNNKWHALYSQHTPDKSNADFDTAYYTSPKDVFWGLNIYGNVWTHI